VILTIAMLASAWTELGTPRSAWDMVAHREVSIEAPYCRVDAVAVTMALTRERIAAKDVPMGLWNIIGFCRGMKPTPEQVELAIYEAGGDLSPRFLTAQQVGPVLMAAAGGREKKLQRILLYAGRIAAAGASAAFLGPSASIAVNMVIPLGEEMSRNLNSRIPDVAGLNLEFPRSITLSEGGGFRFSAWSVKIANLTPKQQIIRARIQ
jgi:hypothetical protein